MKSRKIILAATVSLGGALFCAAELVTPAEASPPVPELPTSASPRHVNADSSDSLSTCAWQYSEVDCNGADPCGFSVSCPNNGVPVTGACAMFGDAGLLTRSRPYEAGDPQVGPDPNEPWYTLGGGAVGYTCVFTDSPNGTLYVNALCCGD